MCSCILGCMPVGHPFVVMKGEGWCVSATCVPWYVPRSNTGLSKHSDPVFPHFCPLNQNLARVMTRGGGLGIARGEIVLLWNMI